MVAPFADTDTQFAASRHYGYRFLVVRTGGDSCTGRIVELVARQAPAPEKVAYLALAGARPFLAGYAPGPVADFTGALLVYSPAYAYQTGLAYEAGTLQPLRMALPIGPVAPDTCYDYYLVGYDNTGTEVIHDYLGSMGCTGGIPGSDGGWGGSTYTGSEGSGGGGGSGNNNIKSFTIDASLAPCAKQVATDVIAIANANRLVGGPVANLINFLGANPNVKVVIKQGFISDKNGMRVGANTEQISASNYVITINSSTVSGAGRITDLSIARNIIHEMLHVYLDDWAGTHGFPTNAGLEVTMMKWFQTHQNFTNADQHNAMTNMTLYMGQALYSYYNSGNRTPPFSAIPINSRYFDDLCWQGLPKTGLSSLDKDRIGIVNKLENERFSGQVTLNGNIIDVAPAGSDTCQ